jgi:conjugal transfer/entry exclusion protein
MLLSLKAQLDQMTAIAGNLEGQLTTLRQAAQGLRPGTALQDILLTERMLQGDTQQIEYSIGTVTRQFERVFPSEAAIKNTSNADRTEIGRGWQNELDQAALAAERSQTTLSRIDGNTRAAQSLLQRSQASTDPGQGSQLAALEAVVQMLGVVNSDVSTLATTIAATERANTLATTGAVTDEAAAAERRRQLFENYSRPEPIPDIDSRVLAPR